MFRFLRMRKQVFVPGWPVAVDVRPREGAAWRCRDDDKIKELLDALKRAWPARWHDRWLLAQPNARVVLHFADGSTLAVRYGPPAEKVHATLVEVDQQMFVVNWPPPMLFARSGPHVGR